MTELAVVRALNAPYASLLPPLSLEERFALEESLREQGQLSEILIDEFDNILDGHNRYEILGPTARTRRFPVSGLSDAEKRAIVFRSSEGRRNLSAEQKRALFEQKKQVAFALRAQDPHHYTQQKIADRLGVSREAISKWFATNGNHTKGSEHRPDARVKLAPEQRAEAVHRVDAGESQAEVAADLGVSRQTVTKVVAIARDTEKPGRSGRGREPYVDHEARNASVRELHDQGLGTIEIAKRLELAPTSVSNVKIKLGIAANSAPMKLWSDVDHVATVLEGAALNIESVAARLEEATELAAEPEEIRRCINSLSTSCKTAKRLLSALRQKLR